MSNNRKENALNELAKLDETILERLVELAQYEKIKNCFSNPLLFIGLKSKLKKEGFLK